MKMVIKPEVKMRVDNTMGHCQSDLLPHPDLAAAFQVCYPL